MNRKETEIREWATRILSGDTLAEKLLDPGHLTDRDPGPPIKWKEPARPPGMELRKRSKSEKLPPFHEHDDATKRAVCLHRFAGHELLAVEIMAYALLAFPEAPKHFRRGLANTLKEEQEHVRLYTERLKGFNIEFGDLPLYRHFWVHTPNITTPLRYVCNMCLTLEMANLDFSTMYRDSFLRYGDEASATLMDRIFHDEIKHVSFGWNWLTKFKSPEESEWETWKSNLSDFLTPRRAKGFLLHEEPRLAAGVSQEWINHLKQA